MYDEFRYYRFGLKIGISNLLCNGFSLGLKKTIGKVSQPINSYTRFPEYFLMERAMGESLAQPCRILDVGSPKLFGFYLAHRYPIDLHLTDIYPHDVTEYKTLWRSVRNPMGKAVFAVQDARRLSYCDNCFDVVYAMSVVEHVEGTDGDQEAIREMMRVLKPGGYCVVSVPYGNRYAEQYRVGFKSAAIRTAETEMFFFQRIYDSRTIRRRLTNGFNVDFLATISRQHSKLTRRYSAMRDDARGLLGFLAPFVSRAVNNVHVGSFADAGGDYGAISTNRDVYGDVIFAARKPAQT